MSEHDGIQRYRRNPKPPSTDTLAVAKYQPGGPRGDLLAVARMADRNAQLAEVQFGDVTVLVVRYTRYRDEGPPFTEYEHVEPGDYLAYSGSDFLLDTDDADLRQWYDLVEG